ncbi:hypothetical protein FPV67DRAFT_640644 [Lyophyllum atratum]|nr:hypothetical protein FPV67DRAFT_640644 [Lyophyllum atratum]
MSSPAGEPYNPPSPSPQKSSRRIAWIPLAAFAGTTVALAIPLVMLARRRQNILRKSLNESSVAPPRRHGTTSGGRFASKPAAVLESSKSKSTALHASQGELLSEVSKTDLGGALFAGKAFAIATGIVTVGGVALTLGVKTVMGVRDTKEFGERMRMAVWKALPSLTTQIHRPPEVDDLGIPYTDSSEPDPTWDWEAAEKRLQAAYADGGFPAWLQTALKETEAEVKLERARRQKEYERAKIRESLS